MTLRRQAWRGALTDAGPLLQQLLLRLAGSSCQQVGQALAALLVRVADVLVGRKAQELVVTPLLQRTHTTSAATRKLQITFHLAVI